MQTSEAPTRQFDLEQLMRQTREHGERRDPQPPLPTVAGLAGMLAVSGLIAVASVVGVIPAPWILAGPLVTVGCFLISATIRERRKSEEDHQQQLEQLARWSKRAWRELLAAEGSQPGSDEVASFTASHAQSVSELAGAVGRELGLKTEALQHLEIAGLLNDVGMVAIPNAILNKPTKLTDEEFELLKTHTIEGQKLLHRVGGRLARVGDIVRSTHERWDGRGYPDGLKGEDIPIAARIVFCSDAYIGMTKDRPWRKAMSPDMAIEELRANAGTQFDPRVVDALVRAVSHHAEQPKIDTFVTETLARRG